MPNREERKGQRVASYTLGCKLNFSETSYIIREFVKRGYRKVDFDEPADIFFINTCLVTAQAEKKSRQVIHKAHRNNPEAVIIVGGCYAQLKGGQLALLPGVRFVLGADEKFDAVNYYEQYFAQQEKQFIHTDQRVKKNFFHAYSIDERTRAFLKVQDGCDYYCTYCIVPYARGNSRNPSVESVVKNAEAIAEKGVKEIVLTGVNIGDFGKSTNSSFYKLLVELEKVKKVQRYRISSIEPDLLTPDIISFIAGSEKFAHHFHIPLQSGSNRLLGLMKRRYERELFKERVELIKEKMPDAGIGVDVIVGFPGETDDDFFDTFYFIEELYISYLHVFTYSKRELTKAGKLTNHVNIRMKQDRSMQLKQLSDKKRKIFYENNIGKIEKVIFESNIKSNKMVGFSGNYVKVEAKPDQERIGKLTKVRFTGIAKTGNINVEFLNDE